MNFQYLLLASIFLTSCMSAPGYIGDKSSHFDGKRFLNRTPMKNKGGWDIFKFLSSMYFVREKWPSWIEDPPKVLPKVEDTKNMSVTFINHSSVLLRHQGQVILTDPLFSDRASPFSWAGPKRVRPPGINKEDLPNINVIVISHNHYDHLDIESLKWLYKNKGEPLILVGLGVGELLKKHDLHNYLELDWDQEHEQEGIKYIFSECRHRSGRGLGDQMTTLWGGFVILTDKHKVYFAGDSGYDAHFKEASKKFGAFDLSLLPIGAYEPRWFMKAPHMNPKEAVQAHLDLKSKLSMGIHFGTFQLTYEKIDQPEKDLAIALNEKGLTDKDFFVPGFGQTFTLH